MAKSAIEEKYREEIKNLEGELLLAKKILKDPNLSILATRKFKSTIDGNHV